MENSINMGGWGWHQTNFPFIHLFFKFKALDVAKKGFGNKLIFFTFWFERNSSPTIMVRWEDWTSKSTERATWQLSDDTNLTEFVSWHVDHFSYFSTSPDGSAGGKEPLFSFSFFFLQGTSIGLVRTNPALLSLVDTNLA